MLSLLSVKVNSCDRGIWFNEGDFSTEEVKRKLYYNIQFRPLYIEQQGILSKLRFYYKLDMFLLKELCQAQNFFLHSFFTIIYF